MPTLEELQREEAWRREQIPPGIDTLRRVVRDHYGTSRMIIGTIGDRRHLKGYHRSRRWIGQSRWCTDRGYSVSETMGNRNGGNDNYIAGVDLVCAETLARSIYGRVRRAQVAGRLPELREVRLESSPWHVHLGLDRGHLDHGYPLLARLINDTPQDGVKLVNVNIVLPELREGSTGPHVITWQTLCNRYGATLEVDGVFGPLTHAATLELQQRFEAESVDGIVGPETWAIGITGADSD